MVIAAHTTAAFAELPYPVKRLVTSGWFGVQLFFLGSAVTLLMSWHAELKRTGRVAIGAFFRRRFLRIAPAYYLAGALYFIAFPPATGFDFWQALRAAAFVNAWHPDWLPTTGGWAVVPGGWSISVEFSFYALFPLFAACITSLRRAVMALGVSVGIGVVANMVVGPGLVDRIGAAAAGNFLFFWFPNQISVFACGFVLFFLLTGDGDRIAGLRAVLRRWATPAALGALLVFFGLGYAPAGHFLGDVPLVPTGQAACVPLMLFVLALAAAPTVFTNRVMAGLGTISFGAYLAHFAVIDGLNAFAGVFHFDATGYAAISRFSIFLAVVVIVTCAIAWEAGGGMAMNRKLKLRVAAVLGAIVAVTLYVALISVFDMQVRSETVTFGVAADTPNRLDVHLEMLDLDAARLTAMVRVSVVPSGGLRGMRAVAPNKDVQLIVRVGDSVQDLLFRANERMSSIDLPIAIEDGSVLRYPFDRYRSVMRWRAFEGSPSSRGAEVPLRFYAYESSPAFDGRIQLAKFGTPGDLSLSISASRPVVIRWFASAIFVSMVAVGVSALAIGFMLFTRRRRLEATLLGALCSMMFAVPVMRNALPGAPPLGIAADLIIFLWVELSVVFGLSLGVDTPIKLRPDLRFAEQLNQHIAPQPQPPIIPNPEFAVPVAAVIGIGDQAAVMAGLSGGGSTQNGEAAMWNAVDVDGDLALGVADLRLADDAAAEALVAGCDFDDAAAVFDPPQPLGGWCGMAGLGKACGSEAAEQEGQSQSHPAVGPASARTTWWSIHSATKRRASFNEDSGCAGAKGVHVGGADRAQFTIGDDDGAFTTTGDLTDFATHVRFLLTGSI
eukprot:gene12920-13021_t